jgi:hypothetical protein
MSLPTAVWTLWDYFGTSSESVARMVTSRMVISWWLNVLITGSFGFYLLRGGQLIFNLVRPPSPAPPELDESAQQ